MLFQVYAVLVFQNTTFHSLPFFWPHVFFEDLLNPKTREAQVKLQLMTNDGSERPPTIQILHSYIYKCTMKKRLTNSKNTMGHPIIMYDVSRGGGGVYTGGACWTQLGGSFLTFFFPFAFLAFSFFGRLVWSKLRCFGVMCERREMGASIVRGKWRMLIMVLRMMIWYRDEETMCCVGSPCNMAPQETEKNSKNTKWESWHPESWKNCNFLGTDSVSS